MTPVFGYLRVSGAAQIEGDGFPRQRLAIETYAAQNTMQVVRWFEERATPGKTEWEDRPAWLEMAAVLTEGQTVLIERLDRLARDLMVQEHIIADLRKRHVVIISVMEPDLCIDDPTRKLLRQIMGAIAEYDRTMIVRKTAAARKRIREATGKCEGRKAYGHRDGEKKILALIHATQATGSSWQQISDELNKAGFKARAGGKWYPATVRKIARRQELISALAPSQ